MVEHRCIKARKAGLKKSPSTFSNDVGDRVTLEYFQSKTSSLKTSSCPECQLSSSITKYRSLVPSRISKRFTSFDEQYFSHCLELIQISAAKAASFNFSITWSPSKTNSSTESSFYSPRNVFAFSSKRWIIGSETRSRSMILRSPFFKQGTTNNDNNSELISLPSVRGSLDSYCDTSHSGFSLWSSPMMDIETGKRKHGSDYEPHKDRSQYTSSILSTSSDRSSCTWPAVSHGMLQCTRRNGITHFVFSVDNKREVYMTRSSKSSLSDGSNLDWTYFIHLSTSIRKEHNARKTEANLVGRINVSAYYKISADGTKIMETEFILYGDGECRERKLDKSSSSYDMGKHRRLPGKVSNFLKPLHLPKHRSNTNTWGTSTSLDLSSLTPEDEDGDSDQIACPNLLENDIPSNFELTAIVVKEQVDVVQQETEVGGWGLSFLKRAKEKQASRQGSEFSSHDRESTVERSMDVLIPAAYHGGPKTRNPGPSSLTERRRNGGQCDCGGWDTGCPFAVLNTRSHIEGWNPEPQKSVNLCVKGDEGRAPLMKMVNIQNGIYYIDFQTRLSALQCFSIAVAVIHSRSPTLRSNTQTS